MTQRNLNIYSSLDKTNRAFDKNIFQTLIFPFSWQDVHKLYFKAFIWGQKTFKNFENDSDPSLHMRKALGLKYKSYILIDCIYLLAYHDNIP